MIARVILVNLIVILQSENLHVVVIKMKIEKALHSQRFDQCTNTGKYPVVLPNFDFM